MGAVKEWGMEIAHQIFDLGMNDDQVIDIQMERAALIRSDDTPPPSREWMASQVAAVRASPEAWGHDKGYWHRLRRSWDKYASRFNAKLSHIRPLTDVEKRKVHKRHIMRIVYGKRKR